MFDLIFDTVFSFQAVMLCLGGLFCLGLGGLLVADFVHWRSNAKRTKGKIVTFKERSGSKGQSFFYPVAEFQNEKGETVRITSDVGSSNLNERDLNKNVTILYFPGKDKDPRILGHGIPIMIVGVVLLIGAAVLLYNAILMFEAGWPLIIAVLGIAAVGWIKYQGSPASKMSFKDIKDGGAKLMEDMDLKNANKGDEMTLEEIRERSTGIKKQQARWSWLILVMGLVFFGIGYYIGYGVWYLETYGLSAKGEVVAMEASTDSEGSTTYAPVVEYQTAEGVNVRFKSNYSSNPPSYSRGDQVEVLYAEDDPEENVIIDAGWWNWLFPGLFGGIGFLMAILLFPAMRGDSGKAL